MSEGLARAGIKGTYEGALTYVGNPDLISRTHFARFLVEAGHCSDVSEVFRRYLTEGKPGYVEHKWAKPWRRGALDHEAQGVAVIAHPARYGFTPTEEYALITEFIAHGGRGIEVVTGSHTAADAARYTETALEFDLLASRGSDFHSPTESHTDLGKLDFLPGRLKPSGLPWKRASTCRSESSACLIQALTIDHGPILRSPPENPQPRFLKQAAQILQAGGVGAIPTDSSYALVCRLDDKNAAEALRRIRGVDEKHHLTLLCRDLSELASYARVDNKQYRLLKAATPGPFTFILEATREVPRRLSHPSRRTIGLRVPQHKVTQELLALFGEPLLATTLIPPGETEPLNDTEEIWRPLRQAAAGGGRRPAPARPGRPR